MQSPPQPFYYAYPPTHVVPDPAYRTSYPVTLPASPIIVLDHEPAFSPESPIDVPSLTHDPTTAPTKLHPAVLQQPYTGTILVPAGSYSHLVSQPSLQDSDLFLSTTNQDILKAMPYQTTLPQLQKPHVGYYCYDLQPTLVAKPQEAIAPDLNNIGTVSAGSKRRNTGENEQDAKRQRNS
jgi:hypothetical protein